MSRKIGIDFTSVLSRSEVEQGTLKAGVALFCAEIVQGLAENGHGENLVLFSYSWGGVIKKTVS
jgi:hypothetical protein